MLKAELDLTNVTFVNYQHLDLEKEWRSVPVIRIWLKARSFDLTLPIFVTRAKNVMTFFQTKSDSGKTLILVHPNPKILSQLHDSLRQAGHSVHAFKRVEDANQQIKAMIQNGTALDKIVVPTNLKVSYNFTYKSYLNKLYPKFDVVTVDNTGYSQNLSLKIFQKENHVN